MPTKRTRRERRPVAIPDDVLRWFLEEGPRPFTCWLEPERERELWLRNCDAILARWTDRRPGTRPRLWWEYSAPPEPVEGVTGGLEVALPHRRRTGGTGIPAYAASAIWPGFEYGLPVSWSATETVTALFEAQAAYIGRHELFLRGEAKRLAESDFAHELVTTDETAPRRAKAAVTGKGK